MRRSDAKHPASNIVFILNFLYHVLQKRIHIVFQKNSSPLPLKGTTNGMCVFTAESCSSVNERLADCLNNI